MVDSKSLKGDSRKRSGRVVDPKDGPHRSTSSK